MTASPGSLPTFFVIGAAKCGTTSLHHYLSLHPEISMSAQKEPQVFARADYWSELGRYAPLLSAGAPARGESSAVYSQFPRWVKVPERIADVNPEARFLYLVGDPLARVVAHYTQHVADGKEERSLAEALRRFERLDSLYVCPSRYATQVRAYLDWFPADRLLVVDQDELRNRRPETMAEIFRFLEVDATRELGGLGRELNTHREQLRRTALGGRLEQSRSAKISRALPIPSAARTAVRRLVWRELERPTLDESLRDELAASLRGDVDWLRSFSGRAFASWTL